MSWIEIKTKIIQLSKANNTPQEIALGVAIGVFIGITPLYGFHTVLFIIAAMLIPHANKIAILLGTNISLPPTLPLITWLAYNIGRSVLGDRPPLLEWSFLKSMTYKDISGIYSTLFIGSMVLGLICAAVFYFLVLLIAGRIRNKK